jgi:hypothetical protein
MAHRTFTAEPPKSADPVWFDIEGTFSDRSQHDGTWTETFVLVPEMPPGALAMWQRVAASGGRTTEFKPGPVIAFLATILDDGAVELPPDDEYPEGRTIKHSALRFLRITDDTEKLVRLELLVDIMFWAVEVLTDRPSGPASSSPAGQSATPTS